MEGWRRGRTDNYYSEPSRTRSRYKRPPTGNWQQSVPSWEKKFCASVCSIPWWKIVEMKNCLHLYDNVLKWDDSAAKEAFDNAKARFYANMHGLHCDIPIPDPDMFIDEINEDYTNDLELQLDLDREEMVPAEDDDGESGVIFDNTFVSNQGFSGTGWGDIEQEGLKKVEKPSGDNDDNLWNQNGELVKGNEWGDVGNYTACWNVGSNSGGAGVAYGGWDGGNGWGNDWNNNNSGWGNDWNNNNEWGYGWNNSYSWGWNGYGNNTYRHYGHGQGTGGYVPRYKAPRGGGGGQRQIWKNGNGRRRGNFASGKQGRDGTQVS